MAITEQLSGDAALSPEAAKAYIADMLGGLQIIAADAHLTDVNTLLQLAQQAVELER